MQSPFTGMDPYLEHPEIAEISEVELFGKSSTSRYTLEFGLFA
jgi:hypothetical protein